MWVDGWMDGWLDGIRNVNSNLNTFLEVKFKSLYKLHSYADVDVRNPFCNGVRYVISEFLCSLKHG
jgi:hypothetical protein